MLSEYEVYKNEATKQFNLIKEQNSYCLFFAGTKTEIVSYLAYRIVSMSEVFSDLSDRKYSGDEKLFISTWIGELYEAHMSIFPVDFTDNKCYVVSQKNGYKIKPIVETARKFISRTRGEV